MAEIFKEHWYKVDFKKATYFCECAGFTLKPFDLFDFETKIFYHNKSGLQFKFKSGQGENIEFFMSPYKGDNPITFEDFEKEWEAFNGKQGKVETVKDF